MAVVNVKSTSITNQDANVATPGTLVNGGLRGACEVVTLTNGDSIASTYRLFRIQSNARMSALNVFCAAITTCAGDIGLYRTATDGGAVVSSGFFTAAQTLAAASPGINVLGGNVLAPAARNKKLWQALGLATDPAIYYDVTITLTAAAASTGAVGADAVWTV